jgi:hypothetical protein
VPASNYDKADSLLNVAALGLALPAVIDPETDSRNGSLVGVKRCVGPPRGTSVSAQIAIPRGLSRPRLVKSLIGAEPPGREP